MTPTLNCRDPKERPTAKQALQHPWLQGGSVEDRFSTKSKGLKTEVVQRIQRYGQSTLVRRTLLEYLVDEMLADDTVPPPGSTYPANGTVTLPSCNLDLNALKKHLEVAGEGQPVDYATMERLLHKLGYRLHPEEVEHLMQAMDIGRSGRVTVSQFVASQIDWPAVERLHNELFAESARRAFSSLDIDGDGLITKDELCLVLQSHLATDDLQPAVEEALKEMELKGCSSGSGTMDINGFMSLLHAPSYDSLLSLDQYDEKMSSCPSSTSLDTLLADLESSIRDGSLHNTKEWQELEKSVKNGKLHNTKEWQDLEKSVKGAKALHALFGHNSNKTHGHENSQSAAQRQESCADTN